MAIDKSQLEQTVWPEEILRLPRVEIPVAGAVGYSLMNEEKQLLFIMFPEGASVPDHSHRSQTGYLVTGEMTLEIGGRTEFYQPGDVYHIPAGTSHRTHFSKNTHLIDLGDDPGRFPLVGRR